eukprot:c19450_g1_i1 orf=2-514(-)
MEGLLLGSLATVEHFTQQDQSEPLRLQTPILEGATQDSWLLQSMLDLRTKKRASKIMEVADEEVGFGRTTRAMKELHLGAQQEEGAEAMKVIREIHFNAQQEEGNEVLILHDRKVFQDDFDEAVSLVASLKDCTKQRNLLKGSKLHADIIRTGLFDTNVFIGNALVNMYAK